jgi:hypothetical protein
MKRMCRSRLSGRHSAWLELLAHIRVINDPNELVQLRRARAMEREREGIDSGSRLGTNASEYRTKRKTQSPV